MGLNQIGSFGNYLFKNYLLTNVIV